MNPILFIHGFGGKAKEYRPIMKYLEERGINDFYEFNYDNKYGFSPIKVIAKELAEFIENNIKEKESINIIALSQGGIIALAYLKFYKNINVGKIFTICSPHKGSRLARIAKLPGLIDLQPGSELLRELEDFGQKNKLNVYSLYTPFDLMVFPGWNARAKYGKRKIIFAPTHPVAFSWPETKRFIYKNIK